MAKKEERERERERANEWPAKLRSSPTHGENTCHEYCMCVRARASEFHETLHTSAHGVRAYVCVCVYTGCDKKSIHRIGLCVHAGERGGLIRIGVLW